MGFSTWPDKDLIKLRDILCRILGEQNIPESRQKYVTGYRSDLAEIKKTLTSRGICDYIFEVK